MANARNIIRRREIVADDWRYVEEDPTVSETRALILPLARWHEERSHWWLWAGRLGVRIAPADRVELLRPDLTRLALIAIEFTSPSEGRGYSQGRILRDRLGFSGELRAVGYVKRDQLFFLARCGFDAFELSPGVEPQSALTAFNDFDVSYQPATTSTREQRHFYVHSR
jgi:uncharacterized protein (DUF934 family)